MTAVAAAPKPRVPVHAGDPDAVFEHEARLLNLYRDAIVSAIGEVVEVFPDPELRQVAGGSFIERIGSEIPDPTIRAAVKRLAILKFRGCGIELKEKNKWAIR